jgi:hypothetical protein
MLFPKHVKLMLHLLLLKLHESDVAFLQILDSCAFFKNHILILNGLRISYCFTLNTEDLKEYIL